MQLQLLLGRLRDLLLHEIPQHKLLALDLVLVDVDLLLARDVLTHPAKGSARSGRTRVTEARYCRRLADRVNGS